MIAVAVSLRHPGWHAWPSAPEHRAYLRHAHRHLFHYALAITVPSGSREIEFHDMLGWLAAVVGQLPVSRWRMSDACPADSCEELAVAVARSARAFYGPDTSVRASVSEDGECWAICALGDDPP